MTINQAREYTVVVNGGSGCIVQPMTDAYCYILTAKHNIVEAGGILTRPLVSFRYVNDEWTENVIPVDSLVVGENYFPHEAKDIAIIKISPVVNGCGHAVRFDGIEHESEGYFLLGYPETRRNGNADVWFRRDIVSIADPRGNGIYEAIVDNIPTIEEVRGHSGGCIVKVRGDSLLVAGIQNRMAAEDEFLGRVHFTSIKSFDEIIGLYSLAPLLPNHLRSFSFLKSESFNLNTTLFYRENIQGVKNFLRARTESIIQSRHTPIGIKNLFHDRLLLYCENKHEKDHILYSKVLWVIWLEFLTIINLLKEMNFSDAELNEIFNSIRLICSDTDADWSDELKNMVYSNYKGLRKNGVVIVGVNNAPADDITYVIDPERIPLIGKAHKDGYNSELLQIDDGIKFPLKDFRFIHIEYFKKKAIILKHEEWAAIETDEELLEKLKEEYKILLS
jgi:hypothetical protein